MNVKRLAGGALAVVLLFSCLLMGGCSTPPVAMEVDGKSYATADYLAYMYGFMMTDSTVYSNLYYYGDKAMDQKATYGEGDDAKEVKLDEYIILKTKDLIIRQKVLEDMLNEYSIKWDDKEVQEMETQFSSLETDQFIRYGFNNSRYINMVKALSLNESTLFRGLYATGGSREVSDEDIRTYFDKNYRSYKIIEISLTKDDSDSTTGTTAMTEEEIAAVKKQLTGYLDTFNKTQKTGKDFDTVYAQYAKEANLKDSDGNTLTTAERQELVMEKATDEDLAKAVDAVPVGTAAIQTYKKNGSTDTMALILRMDPEKEREDGVDYYKNSRDAILQNMKGDELTEEVDNKVAELKAGGKVVYHDRVIKACKPADMIADN